MGKILKNIIGVRFKKLGKIYFFNPRNLHIKKGDKVIVETTQGEEIGEVVIPNRHVDDEKIIGPLKKVLRIATYKDYKRYDECKKIEKEAFKICEKKIKEHKLKMCLTDVECKFDNSKILFYFTADGRIELCCCTFLSDFEAVSIKMAKEQNISLNPSKISGNCGRLMCCLKYEDEVYQEKLKKLPNIGAIVKTEDGVGEVEGIETLRERVKVKLKNEEGFSYKRYDVKDLKIIKDSSKENIDEEEKQHKKELEELEKLEELDIKGGE